MKDFSAGLLHICDNKEIIMKDFETIVSLYFEADQSFALNCVEEGYSDHYDEHYDSVYDDASYGPYGNKK